MDFSFSGWRMERIDTNERNLPPSVITPRGEWTRLREELFSFDTNSQIRMEQFVSLLLEKSEKRVSIRSIEFLSRFFLETTSPFSFGSRERHDGVVSR